MEKHPNHFHFCEIDFTRNTRSLPDTLKNSSHFNHRRNQFSDMIEKSLSHIGFLRVTPIGKQIFPKK